MDAIITERARIRAIAVALVLRHHNDAQEACSRGEANAQNYVARVLEVLIDYIDSGKTLDTILDEADRKTGGLHETR